MLREGDPGLHRESNTEIAYVERERYIYIYIYISMCIYHEDVQGYVGYRDSKSCGSHLGPCRRYVRLPSLYGDVLYSTLYLLSSARSESDDL